MASQNVIGPFRDRMGPVGVWLGSLRPAPIDLERLAVCRIEGLGYGSLWTGEVIGGKEAFAHLSLLLATAGQMVIGSGIANIWARHPAAMQGGGATLGASYPGRFILGIGVSHASLVGPSGQAYRDPLRRMTEYLDGMDAAVADAPRTEVPVPRVLAALGPQMLALARDRADGLTPLCPAHPYRGRRERCSVPGSCSYPSKPWS